jgi:hypothetical protein
MTHPTDTPLARAVDQWAHTTQGIADSALSTTWEWRGYEEGIRFAFFRVMEELRTLAANLTAERARTGPPITAAQHAMAQYNAAWHDLDAVLLGVSDDVLDQAPDSGDWPIYMVMGHMFAVPRNFFAQTAHALTLYRAGTPIEAPMPDEQVAEFLGHTWEQYEIMMEGTRAGVLANYAAMHNRIIRFFADVTEEELSAPTLWWESYEIPVQFRLHRFESHMRQHTVQIEKGLASLGLAPSEAKRLNRHIYAALADCEGVLIGAWDLGEEPISATTQSITDLTAEIAQLIAG